MGTWNLGYPIVDCSCSCSAPTVATLNLTVHGCSVSPAVGSVVTLTQGATTLTATSNGSAVATFSLPATGSWAYSLAPPPSPSGYRTTTGTIAGIVAGSNSRTVNVSPDIANDWACCGSFGTGDHPIRGPLALTITSGLPCAPMSLVLTPAAGGPNPDYLGLGTWVSPVFLCGGTYYVFYNSGMNTALKLARGTNATFSGAGGFTGSTDYAGNTRNCDPYFIGNDGADGGPVFTLAPT